jgi:hypothetical protein
MSVDAMPLTSLETPETNEQASEWEELPPYDCPDSEFRIEPITRAETLFRHSGWQGRRVRMFAAMQRTGANRTCLDRFYNCGSGAWLELSDATHTVKAKSNHCHSRWCVPCQAERARFIYSQMAEQFPAGRLRFVTLTLRCLPSIPLKDSLDRLYRSFKELRRRPFWKQYVAGGLLCLEVKLGKGSDWWHPHLHILTAGVYMPQKELAQEWLNVTGDSSICWIRDVPPGDDAKSYVAKYVTKAVSTTVEKNPARLDEAIIAMKGRRTLATFGDWRGKVRLNEKAPDDPETKLGVGRLADWHDQARAGDRVAAAVWLAAKTGEPVTQEVYDELCRRFACNTE